MSKCLNCGKPVNQKPKTRTKKYCDNTCKMQAFYKRKAEVSFIVIDSPVSIVTVNKLANNSLAEADPTKPVKIKFEYTESVPHVLSIPLQNKSGAGKLITKDNLIRRPEMKVPEGLNQWQKKEWIANWKKENKVK